MAPTPLSFRRPKMRMCLQTNRNLQDARTVAVRALLPDISYSQLSIRPAHPQHPFQRHGAELSDPRQTRVMDRSSGYVRGGIREQTSTRPLKRHQADCDRRCRPATLEPLVRDAPYRPWLLRRSLYWLVPPGTEWKLDTVDLEENDDTALDHAPAKGQRPAPRPRQPRF